MILTAKVSDLPQIVQLELAAFGDAAWTSGQWLEELSQDNRLVLIHSDTANVSGVATFKSLLDEAELYRIAVAEPHRGQGIAVELARQGFAWARERGAKKVFLEVSSTNAAAIALYEKLGFVTVNARANYYGPGDDALIMVLNLAEKGTEND